MSKFKTLALAVLFAACAVNAHADLYTGSWGGLTNGTAPGGAVSFIFQFEANGNVYLDVEKAGSLHGLGGDGAIGVYSAEGTDFRIGSASAKSAISLSYNGTDTLSVNQAGVEYDVALTESLYATLKNGITHVQGFGGKPFSGNAMQITTVDVFQNGTLVSQVTGDTGGGTGQKQASLMSEDGDPLFGAWTITFNVHDIDDGGDYGLFFLTVGNGYGAKPTDNATPEPATLALFGLGLGGLALARRRRK